ncbi:TIGR02281 family clan AA aspartic protease [Phenylobacterium hankyongense]|nr:TIGR02281 family clan AA aspartic protease [Phenylobacterium hankyongense]
MLRFAMVSLVAGVSAVVAAHAVVVFAREPLALRAAKAEAPLVMAATGPLPAPQGGAVMKASDGHFWADGDVNGQAVHFLVDTGATAVALTPKDAERLGFDLSKLHYGYAVVTAGGQARAAGVKLASISVAGARLENVDALVIERGLDASLLGMTYLGRLSSFQATRQALFLQP